MSALCALCIAFPNQCLLFRVKCFYHKHCAQTWLHRSKPAVKIYCFLCLSPMEILIGYASNKFESENPVTKMVLSSIWGNFVHYERAGFVIWCQNTKDINQCCLLRSKTALYACCLRSEVNVCFFSQQDLFAF